MNTQLHRTTQRLRTALGLLLATLLAAAGGGLLLAAPSAAQPEAPTLNWTQVHNAPGVFWYTVVFPTPLVGYALGGPDWNVNEGIGASTLAKTTDGGQTWSTIPVPNTNRFMRGLACVDANRCWVIGASSPRIRYTLDGGATWQSGAIVNNVWSGWLWSAGASGVGTTLFAGTTGYAAEPGRMANLLRSTDGVNFGAVVANDPREFVIYDFSCPSPGVCYSAAKQSTFYTGDNGVTLTRRGAPSARYYGVWCTTNSTCWLVGGSNSAADNTVHIQRSTDGGLNWQMGSAASISGRPRLWNIQMVDSQHGYAVGCTNVPDAIAEICTGQGLLLRTDDGVTWQQVASPAGADIMDLYVQSMDDLVIVDWSGKIWRGLSGTPPPTPTPTPTATPVATPNPYDVNNDGVVDIQDIMLVAAHWQP